MESESFNLESFFSFIGLDDYNTTRPEANLETLTQIIKGVVNTIHYQNLDLQAKRSNQTPVSKEDLLLKDIQKKLVDEKRGGMCYEINLYVEAALTAIGYKLKMVSGYTTPYDPKKLPSHLGLLVELGSDHYFVDPGFGFSFLYPIKFDWKETQEVAPESGWEKYQLVVADDHYQINLIVPGGNIIDLVYFLRDGSLPRTTDRETILSEYVGFMADPAENRWRDSTLIAHKATKRGRLHVQFDRREKGGYMFAGPEKKGIESFEVFSKEIKEGFGNEVPLELEKA